MGGDTLMNEDLNITLRWVTYWLKKTDRTRHTDHKVRQICYDILADLLRHKRIKAFNMATAEVTLNDKD